MRGDYIQDSRSDVKLVSLVLMKRFQDAGDFSTLTSPRVLVQPEYKTTTDEVADRQQQILSSR